MTTSAKSVEFDDNSMSIMLSDGRTLGVPMAFIGMLSTRISRSPVC
ncbi:MAG: hypothetical protein ACI8WM_000857 [Burkholderiaceae bacterium]|jgi:hypothetical protein